MTDKEIVHKRVVMTSFIGLTCWSCLLCFLFIAVILAKNDSRNAFTTSWSSLAKASLSLLDKPETKKQTSKKSLKIEFLCLFPLYFCYFNWVLLVLGEKPIVVMQNYPLELCVVHVTKQTMCLQFVPIYRLLLFSKQSSGKAAVRGGVAVGGGGWLLCLRQVEKT